MADSNELASKLKLIKTSNAFCPEPFISTVTTGKTTQPCCLMKNWDFDNSEEKTLAIQKEMLGNGGPLFDYHCLICKEQEKHPAPSHRQKNIEHWLTGKYKEYTGLLCDAIDAPKMHIITYRAPNNFCNLRCHMCKPSNSSSLAAEDKAIGVETAFSAIHSKSLIKLVDSTDYTEALCTIFELRLVGGETLAIKKNYELMQQAIDLGTAKDIELDITTNATLTPKFDGKDIFDFIPHFKSCKMYISIELWGDKNSYIRFPSKWQTIYDNAIRFTNSPRTTVTFACCISSLNVGYFNEMAAGTHQMILDYPGKIYPFISDSLVVGKNLYKIQAVPLIIREQYLDKYYSNTHPNYVQTFGKLCSYLENIEYSEELMWKMLADVKKRDKHRGTCLTSVFPEWKPYYDRV
jgi:organic radical activating enzyme